MAQPMVEGRKAVKFAEPIVQGTLITHLRFSCIHVCSLTFVPITFFGGPHLWRQLPCDDMATGFDAPCHLRFFCCHAAFDIWASTWQLKLFQHGNCSYCHMANTVQYTWQLDLPHHATCIFSTMLHFFIRHSHGKWSRHNMATAVAVAWYLQYN